MNQHICRTTFLATMLLASACGQDFEDGVAGAAGTGPDDTPGTGENPGPAGQGGNPADAGPPQDSDSPDSDSSETSSPDVDTSCPDGWADCDGDPSNQCEVHLADHTSNCGSCGNACALGQNAAASCQLGKCVYSCESGFDDCDNDPSNGCEADLGGVDNCLGCGNVCEGSTHASAMCTASGCAHDCESTWGDCDGDPLNSCEADLESNAEHCGACDSPCPTRPNAEATCASTTCGFTCLDGYEDCDGTVGNGCEVNVDSDVANCGACGEVCSSDHGSASCAAGTCAFACDVGWEDCDGSNVTGCETNVDADLDNCGACGNVCGYANGMPGCSSAGCSIVCHAGYGDCDADDKNGCEINLNDNANHCGACGRSCLGAACVDGLCQPAQLVSADDFTVASGYVYATYGGQLVRSFPGASLSAVLATNQPHARQPVVANGQVYFLSGWTETKVQSVATTPTSPIAIPATITSQPATVRLVYHNERLYSTTPSGIRWANAQPGSTSHALPGTVGAADLRVNDTWIYFVSTNAGQVRRVTTDGNPPQTLANGQSEPVDVVLDSAAASWVNRGDGTVRRTMFNGDLTTAVAEGMGTLATIAQDGDVLYWANDEGQVWRAGSTGENMMMIADGQGAPYHLLVDGNWVYWLDRVQHRVKRVAK